MLVGRLAAPAPQARRMNRGRPDQRRRPGDYTPQCCTDKYHPHSLIGPIRRKVQILKLLMQGYSNMAIAATLDIDQEAVKSTRRSMVEHLTRYCNQIGITPPELPAPKRSGWESRYYLPNHGCRVGPRQKRRLNPPAAWTSATKGTSSLRAGGPFFVRRGARGRLRRPAPAGVSTPPARA